jgi:hypothetical protein
MMGDKFLMHRVELKVRYVSQNLRTAERFLMHRVELKATFDAELKKYIARVPNAPCGVEST